MIQICSRLWQRVHAHAHVANMRKGKEKSHPITHKLISYKILHPPPAIPFPTKNEGKNSFRIPILRLLLKQLIRN